MADVKLGRNAGPNNPRWKGGRKRHNAGYWLIYAPGHPHVQKGSNYVLEHVFVASKALGKPLPKGAVVHHVNGDKEDNRPQNLVICPDRDYHALIHARQRAMEACGNPNWRPCKHCGEYDTPENLSASGENHYHKACATAYARERREAA